MNQKVKTLNCFQQFRVSKTQPAGKRVALTACTITQPPPPTQSLLAAIDRLCARALALAYFDLDYDAEIELARRLAANAEGRVAG